MTKKLEKLGTLKIYKNNTIIEQIARKNLEINNSYAEHLFTKFVNCTVGNTFLSVNINNGRALSFYKKMGMTILNDYISKTDNKKKIIFAYNKNIILNLH